MAYRILVVDHGSGAAERLREPLARAGHEIAGAAGVVEALLVVEQKQPDVVLIDDAGPDEATAALCARLGSPGRKQRTAVIVLADRASSTADPAERAKRIGCDRVLDSAIDPAEILDLLAHIAPVPLHSSHDEHAERIEDTNRDALSAESFHAAIESPLLTEAAALVAADESGRDIEAHLDSLFAASPVPAKAKPQAPRAVAAAPATPPVTDPVLPLVDPRSSGSNADAPPRPRTAAPAAQPPQASQKAAAAAPRHAPVPDRPPAQAPRPATSPGVAARTPSPMASATVSEAPPPTARDTARKPPKALEQLRQPRGMQAPADVRRSPWPPPPVALGVAGVLVAAAAIAGFVFLRPSPQTPAPAQDPAPAIARQLEPAPAPAAPENRAAELPAPPDLDPQAASVDFAAPAIPMAPAVARAKDEPPAAAAAPPKRASEAAASPRAAETRVPDRPAAGAVVAATASSKPPADEPPAKKKEQPAPPPATAAVTVAPAERAVESSPPAIQTAGMTPTPMPPAASDPASATAPAAPAATAAEEPIPEPQEPPQPSPAAAPVTVPPEVIERVEPTYAPSALKKVDDPLIVLRILVDEQGRIARVVVERGIPGSELESAAISAVLRWRYRPGTESGVPVAAWTSARFDFKR